MIFGPDPREPLQKPSGRAGDWGSGERSRVGRDTEERAPLGDDQDRGGQATPIPSSWLDRHLIQSFPRVSQTYVIGTHLIMK